MISATSSAKHVARSMYTELAKRLKQAEQEQMDTTCLVDAIRYLIFAWEAPDEKSTLEWINQAIRKCFREPL